MASFQNVQVTNEMIPTEIKKPIMLGTSENDFNVRLEEGGTMELDGGEWIIGSPAFGSNTSTFVALDSIILKNGARIITNGNLLTIIVNKFKSENGKILSFPQNAKADNGDNGVNLGESGSAGAPGDHGGKVTVICIQEFLGVLTIDLSGQNGGNGGNGVVGAEGARGDRGPDARDGYLYCERGGGKGAQGATGMPGGNGGDGGVGGAGGFLEVLTIGDQPLDQVQYSFISSGGAGGIGGNPGAGGAGGNGGPGGHGSKFCGGGKTGDQGPIGTTGAVGSQGLRGADGANLVKNLKLAAVIQLGVAKSGSFIS
ncbi:MAG: hypothetical protein EOO52_14335 [Gammaproteobacteria bacterium]|nr:MAG: hypothetical protein EOO52_14335 [Gammaproteobacteria bacterium]